jgi:hypothetical protein
MTTRRGFLKMGGVSLASLLIHPAVSPVYSEPTGLAGLARVAVQVVYLYSEPSFRSQRAGALKRDQIIAIYEEVISAEGPEYNPRWYRLSQGYVHSGRLQRVDGAHYHHKPLKTIPEGGQLGEICVPLTESYRYLRSEGWRRLYRLYYRSVHWITGMEAGPHGGEWYRLTDDLLHAHHYVPAAHVRPIDPQELSPISANVPPEEKRIRISIEDQTLTAFEGDQMVLTAKVSTGIPTETLPGKLPTETPRGRFRVQTKMPSRHMGDGNLTDDLEAYELPGVPWVCFFHKDGIAMHGTYWHDNFGRMMSHGCVNLRNEDALWLYRWTTPIASERDWYVREMGTVIDIT